MATPVRMAWESSATSIRELVATSIPDVVFMLDTVCAAQRDGHEPTREQEAAMVETRKVLVRLLEQLGSDAIREVKWALEALDDPVAEAESTLGTLPDDHPASESEDEPKPEPEAELKAEPSVPSATPCELCKCALAQTVCSESTSASDAIAPVCDTTSVSPTDVFVQNQSVFQTVATITTAERDAERARLRAELKAAARVQIAADEEVAAARERARRVPYVTASQRAWLEINRERTFAAVKAADATTFSGVLKAAERAKIDAENKVSAVATNAPVISEGPGERIPVEEDKYDLVGQDNKTDDNGAVPNSRVKKMAAIVHTEVAGISVRPVAAADRQPRCVVDARTAASNIRTVTNKAAVARSQCESSETTARVRDLGIRAMTAVSTLRLSKQKPLPASASARAPISEVTPRSASRSERGRVYRARVPAVAATIMSTTRPELAPAPTHRTPQHTQVQQREQNMQTVHMVHGESGCGKLLSRSAPPTSARSTPAKDVLTGPRRVRSSTIVRPLSAPAVLRWR